MPADVHGEIGVFAFVGPRKENYTLTNATIVNYDRPLMNAFGSCSHCIFLTTQDQGARTTQFSNIKLFGSTISENKAKHVK